MSEEIIKHLELIQKIINRLGQNSFLIKGWSTVMTSVIILFLLKNEISIEYILSFSLIAFVPMAFGALDAYYLSQERLFRGLYDEVRKQKETDFDMQFSSEVELKNKWLNAFCKWFKAFFSPTILFFYITQTGFISLIYFFERQEDIMRKVFFSFDQDDVFRANVVRKSWVTKDKGKAAGRFIDKADIEKLKRTSDEAIENWINQQLQGTSVTCVLIGTATYKSRWVKYEIKQSILKGNGLLGIYIHKIKDLNGLITTQGSNPLPGSYATYAWFYDDGYNNLGDWIEKAARQAGE